MQVRARWANGLVGIVGELSDWKRLPPLRDGHGRGPAEVDLIGEHPRNANYDLTYRHHPREGVPLCVGPELDRRSARACRILPAVLLPMARGSRHSAPAHFVNELSTTESPPKSRLCPTPITSLRHSQLLSGLMVCAILAAFLFRPHSIHFLPTQLPICCPRIPDRDPSGHDIGQCAVSLHRTISMLHLPPQR